MKSTIALGLSLAFLVLLPVALVAVTAPLTERRWSPEIIDRAIDAPPFDARRRLAAMLLDAALVVVYIGLMAVVMTTALGLENSEATTTPVFYISLLTAWLCFGVTSTNLGGTPGKLRFGGRVVRSDGAPTKPGFLRSLIRVMLAQTSFLLCGPLFFVVPLASEQARALHDFLLKTRVVDSVSDGV